MQIQIFGVVFASKHIISKRKRHVWEVNRIQHTFFLGSHGKKLEKVYEVAMNEAASMGDVIGDHYQNCWIDFKTQFNPSSLCLCDSAWGS